MRKDSVEPKEPSRPETDEDTNVQPNTDPKAGGTREKTVKPEPKRGRGNANATTA